MKRLLILLFAVAMLVCGCRYDSFQVRSIINEELSSEPSVETAVISTAEPTLVPQNDTSNDSAFEIDFIDVGQGDSILVQCDGCFALIDGGGAEYSSKIYSILKNRGINKLNYVFATHNDSDHIGGLAGALHFAEATRAFSSSDKGDSIAFENYYERLEQQGINIEIPKTGDIFPLGKAQIMILGPLCDYPDENNNSLVIKITFGNTSFLLMGDAEFESEQDLISSGIDLSANVIKIGHHGSSSSSGLQFLRLVGADYAVVSVGEDNAYGHPTEETLSRLSDCSVTILRTDCDGTIVCHSDGENLSFSNESKISRDNNPVPSVSDNYIGNKKSLVFHRSSCPNLPMEKNRVYFETREDALNGGFEPCQNCNP